MTLASITDSRAVTDAIDEASTIGRIAFLDAYGFRPARKYFLLWEGRHFDSKAILGAAHGYQHGTPLKPEDFSGGDATVVSKLESLGFTVVNSDSWAFDEGELTLRSQVKELYGGTIYGGIEPSRSTPNIILYTDPEEGAKHGYTFDGWDPVNPDLFHYTGEGTKPEQVFTDGNRAILEHAESGRTLRLFHTIDKVKRVGGKRQEYLGAFYLSPKDPWRYEMTSAPDGSPRKVIVFHLLKDGAAPTPGTSKSTPVLAPPVLPPTPGAPKITHVPSENNTSFEFTVPATEPKVARKVEAELVSKFGAWLESQGHATERIRIEAPGLESALMTDTFDKTENVLYEAKASADRGSIRLAIGQLQDYLRFLPAMKARILLPEAPIIDLEDLILHCGFGLAYVSDDGEWIVQD